MKPARLIAILLVAVLGVAVPCVAHAKGVAVAVQQLETGAYPTVTFALSLPPALSTSAEPRVAVSENGVRVADVKVEPLSGPATPASVVLVIDTSGSMDGTPLEHAKDAARAFVRSIGDAAQVAVVSFDDKPTLRSGFTDDALALESAISSLEARGETALHDAVVAAARLFPQSGVGQKSIIVLSDGGDTTSDASLEKAMNAVGAKGVPIYAVTLKSDEYNPKALETLAKSTGGRLVPASRADQLSGLFEGIAAEISSAYLVTFSSTTPSTKDVELDVEVEVAGQSGIAQVAYSNPDFESASAAPVRFRPVTEDPVRLGLFLGLAFGSVALLVLGVLFIAFRDRSTIDQLRYYDQLQSAGDNAADHSPSGHMRALVVDAVGQVAGRRGLMRLVSERLEAAGLQLRPAEYITGHLLAVIGTGVAVELLTGRFALALIVVLLVTFGPILALDIAVDRRRSRFEGQLPDVLNMISGSLRAGWGIQQAIGLVVQEAAAPSSTEFARVDTEVRLGLPLERALQSMSARMNSADFRAAVGAITIQREVGGNLAEVLDIVAATIRDRDALRRHIKALTAEGRLSAYILIALPFVILAVMVVVSPDFLSLLYTTGVGLVLLLVAVVLLVVGSFWLYRVTRIEV